MSRLQNVSYENEPADIKNKVQSYWTKRADSFSEHKHNEAHSYKAELWKSELISQLPRAEGKRIPDEAEGKRTPDEAEGKRIPYAGEGKRILDVGCGAGFFEMLLAPLGYSITGIDLTSEMIMKGRELLERHSYSSAELLVMDAERLDFPDECFDAVISRNLTWTLPHPAAAYKEWHRVLKQDGVLLNYDAEYAKGFHKFDQAENCAHTALETDLIEECHNIYHMLSVSTFDRPKWDVEELKKIGFAHIYVDSSAGDRLYGVKDQFYMPDRMFRIRAVK